MVGRRGAATACGIVLGAVGLLLLPGVSRAEEDPAPRATEPATVAANTITCSSKLGDRSLCPADTSRGVVLARSWGESACLLGKTWGYEDAGVWVQDGCAGEFLPGTPR